LVGAANVLATTDEQIAMAKDIIEMQNYLAERVEFYRNNPGDSIIADIARAEHEGKLLDMAEILSMLMQLLAAGNETTTSAMGMGMELLIRGNYETLLREQPEKMLNFVEEVLRLHAPIQGLFRRALADTEIRGVKIPAGSIVMLRWAAGNRDPRKYEEADEVVLDRRAPMQHLTFGFGTHFCVGNALARTELRIMFTTLLARLKNFRLDGEPELLVHGFARGLKHLPIRYEVI
jgi:cytochrome P450